MRIPINDECKWMLCRVPKIQIQLLNYIYPQLLSAPGIHVANGAWDIFRVSVHPTYYPWFCHSQFEEDLQPMEPTGREIELHGRLMAKMSAAFRYYRDALTAVSANRPGLDKCYRHHINREYQPFLEWEILRRDLVTSPYSLIKI